MTTSQAFAIIAALGALALVGRGVLARSRRGEPVRRSMLAWAIIFGSAFLIAGWYGEG